MKAKCVNPGCGYEFDDEKNTHSFFDTLSDSEQVGEDPDILLSISRSDGYVNGLVFCPLCRSKCIELKEV